MTAGPEVVGYGGFVLGRGEPRPPEEPSNLLRQIEASGVVLRVKGGRIGIRGDPANVAQWVDRIRERKQDILDLLVARQALHGEPKQTHPNPPNPPRAHWITVEMPDGSRRTFPMIGAVDVDDAGRAAANVFGERLVSVKGSQ